MKVDLNENKEYKCPRCRKILSKHIQGGEVFYVCDKHGIGRREVYEIVPQKNIFDVIKPAEPEVTTDDSYEKVVEEFTKEPKEITLESEIITQEAEFKETNLEEVKTEAI